MRTVLATAAVLAIAACSSPQRGSAPPVDVADRALVLGYPSRIRTWSDKLGEEFLVDVKQTSFREIEAWRARAETGPVPRADYLAISGGGANGAFGAGLLCGWTDRGTRPEFKVVTGISTGALMAPFAFLGPAYDGVLREFYTTTRTKDVLKEKGLLSGFFGDSLADSTPLARNLRRTVTRQVLDEIAAEAQRGRLLLVGTTNLDSQRGVMWNITAIAESGQPDALELVHCILLASAAVPGAFPPIMIDVEVDGRRHQEMHVDGGTLSQVFFYPPSLRLSREELGLDRERRLYVIRNGRLAPLWDQIERKTLEIAERAIDTLIMTQGLGDLYRIYMTSMRDDVEFNLAYIPDDFVEVPKELFDPVVMRKLFDVGYAMATSGDAWKSSPPGFALPETRRGLTPGAESRQER